MKPRQPYPTDLTDHEWALIAPYVPQAKRGGRPEHYPKREILNGIFYIVRDMDHPLARWRQQHHKTQAELAALTGIRQGTLARYESGTRIPRKAHLLTLMEITGLPAEAFVLPEQFLRDHPNFLKPGLQRRGE
jgi:transposase